MTTGERWTCAVTCGAGVVGLPGLEPGTSSLSEIDGRALCYPAFPLVVLLRKSYKDGVNLSVQIQPSACHPILCWPPHGWSSARCMAQASELAAGAAVENRSEGRCGWNRRGRRSGAVSAARRPGKGAPGRQRAGGGAWGQVWPGRSIRDECLDLCGRSWPRPRPDRRPGGDELARAPSKGRRHPPAGSSNWLHSGSR
jgi:hypothetical protein